jgi:hypothetical protein
MSSKPVVTVARYQDRIVSDGALSVLTDTHGDGAVFVNGVSVKDIKAKAGDGLDGADRDIAIDATIAAIEKARFGTTKDDEIFAARAHVAELVDIGARQVIDGMQDISNAASCVHGAIDEEIHGLLSDEVNLANLTVSVTNRVRDLTPQDRTNVQTDASVAGSAPPVERRMADDTVAAEQVGERSGDKKGGE